MNFFSLGVQNRIKPNNYLLKLDKLINWDVIGKKLVGIHLNEKNSQGGPRPYNKISMFKAILLGQWHNLSDPGLEEALNVRLDFMMFTKFELGEDVPDETTICRFRNKLIEKGLHETLFREVNAQLETHGIKIKNTDGALLDATVITSKERPLKVMKLANQRIQMPNG